MCKVTRHDFFSAKEDGPFLKVRKNPIEYYGMAESVKRENM